MSLILKKVCRLKLITGSRDTASIWKYSSCFHTVCRVCKNKSTSNVSKQENINVEPPVTFSKTSTYPTKTELFQQVHTNESKNSPLTRLVARLCLLGIVIFVGYAIFIADYNLEMEEKLMQQLPNYAEDMMKKDPKYMERIENLRAKRASSKAG